MEVPPSKRRKVERNDDQAAADSFLDKGRQRAGSFGDRRENSNVPKLVLPAHHAFGVHGVSRQKVQHLHDPPASSEPAPTKIQARQLVGTQVSTVAQAAPDNASTVLAIAIDNGQGTVSELEVPMASQSVYIPGYGELTVTNNGNMPTITATSEPNSVIPPAAIAASQARNQALQTQEAIAKQLNVVPQAPSPASQQPLTTAPAPASSGTTIPQQTAASQSPLAVTTPESRSQQVLSPPPTPVPATPQSSAGSSSYFSSSPTSLSNASPSPHTSNPSTTPPILNPNNSQPPATVNSTSGKSELFLNFVNANAFISFHVFVKLAHESVVELK